jgi:hypothetical protein
MAPLDRMKLALSIMPDLAMLLAVVAVYSALTRLGFGRQLDRLFYGGS